MAVEYEHEGQRVIKAKITPWKLTQTERILFDSATQLQNWKLADKSRRLLADLSNHLSKKMPPVADRPLEEIDKEDLRKAALISVSAIIVRAVGSGMNLIASGYLPESAAPARRALEAKLHARAVLDDPSGEYALRYLKGRGTGISKLAQKYGTSEDVEILSRAAHADVRGLVALHVRPPSQGDRIAEGEISIMPSRNDRLAGFALYPLAYEAVEMCALLVEPFHLGFEVPPWVSGELRTQGEAFRREHESHPRGASS